MFKYVVLRRRQSNTYFHDCGIQRHMSKAAYWWFDEVNNLCDISSVICDEDMVFVGGRNADV